MPLRITYRDLEHTDAVDAHIRKRAEKLSIGGALLPSCHVVVEAPHRHKLHGGHYVVRIEASTADGDIIVDRSPDAARQQESLYAAINAAFDHAVRQLHDHAQRSEAAALRKGRASS
jgi:ribosome-associated translation inhibitor RaiA